MYEIQEKRFASWENWKAEFKDFLPLPNGSPPIINNYVFRGQKLDSWGIVSSFDRIGWHSNDPVAIFSKQMQFFKSLREDRIEGEKLDDITHASAVAQHYGVPTRMLDWTQSPYTAAFFAFFEAFMERTPHADPYIAIFALNLERFKVCKDAENEFEFCHAPSRANPRQRNQYGKYIKAIGTHKDFAEFAQNSKELSDALMKWVLPWAEAETALNDLILMGISPLDIYPDSEGLANYVKLRDRFKEKEFDAKGS